MYNYVLLWQYILCNTNFSNGIIIVDCCFQTVHRNNYFHKEIQLAVPISGKSFKLNFHEKKIIHKNVDITRLESLGPYVVSKIKTMVKGMCNGFYFSTLANNNHGQELT